MRISLFATALLLSVLLIDACARKTRPAVAGTLPPDRPSAVAAPHPDIEAGKVIYNTKCIKCHVAKPVENWNLAQWQPILRSMIKKTRLDSTESAQVHRYVAEFARKE